MKNDISPSQLRAARALLDWSREDLARRTEVDARTIARIELGEVRPRESTIASVRAAFEAAGVLFVDENGEGPGVRWRKGAGV